MQDSFNNAASLTAWRICPGDVLTMKLFDQMRITKAAEYRLPVELIGGDAVQGVFRGDARTEGDGVLTVRLFRVQKERPGLSVSFRGRRR
jgi:hypothetical protein